MRFIRLNITRAKVRGMTLTELLLASAIMAFVLCGLLVLFINASFLNEGNRHLTTAVAHAQYVMEEIRHEDTLQEIRDNIDKQDGHHGWDWDVDDIDSRGLQALSNESISTCCLDSNYTSCLEPCPDKDPLGIYLLVEWEDRRGRERSFQIQTRMTNYQ